MCFSFRRAYKSSGNCAIIINIPKFSAFQACCFVKATLSCWMVLVATPESTKQLDQVSFLDLESLWHGIKEQIEC